MRFFAALGKNLREGAWFPWLRFLTVVIVFVLGIWLGRIALRNDVVGELVHRFGYVGLFFVSLVAGFNVVVPIPAVAFIPLYLAAGMAFWPMTLVMVAGETIADLLSVWLGRTGRELDNVRHARTVKRLERFRKKHFWAPLGLMFAFASAAPFPNEVLAIPLGIMGYRVWQVAIPIFCGNLVFTAVTAYALRAVLWGL
ncbi:MAG TPA: VTT domain-containing protein [Candidatus Binatia bacterium]|jgi:membrane protein YqaA with SNARE-associated domain|nr:VTT domain-containing protein [Candidatus Binatia bacterium]